MLGTNTRVIKTGRNAMGGQHLSVLVLQEVLESSVEYSGISGTKCGGMLSCLDPLAPGFYTNQFHLIGKERVEDADPASQRPGLL